MNELKALYEDRFNKVLRPLAVRIQQHLAEYLKDSPRIDRIDARAKAIEKFLVKAAKVEAGNLKYSDPLTQIQDQVGARVVTFFLDDVESVTQSIKKYFRPIEEKRIVPDSDSEFGYVGKHFILFVPTELIDAKLPRDATPTFFELQIKTLFQHAWSEANHDIGYKPGFALTSDSKRRIAFTAAQAWGADMIFEGLNNGAIAGRLDTTSGEAGTI